MNSVLNTIAKNVIATTAITVHNKNIHTFFMFFPPYQNITCKALITVINIIINAISIIINIDNVNNLNIIDQSRSPLINIIIHKMVSIKVLLIIFILYKEV